jgi:Flp pilus assembly protein TadD
MGDWAKALPVAEQLLGLAPERPSGWMHKAYALRRVEGGGIEQASAVLREAAQRFPHNSLVAFNLACYACQMDREEEALEWLRRAFGSEDKGVLKSMALKDEDLRALWPRIQEL